MPKLTLYCDYVSRSHVHCNRYTTLKVGVDETPREVIEDSEWGVIDGETRCEEHHGPE